MSNGNSDPADPTLSTGQRIRFYRQRRGMTREVLGGLVGKSGRWVKAVELGQLQEPKLPVLLRVAEALRIRDLSQLTGDVSLPRALFAGPGHPALPAVRDAINSVTLPQTGEPETLAHLRARVDSAWRARHAAPDHRTVLGALLPDLLRDARYAARAYDGEDRRTALAILADVYHVCQFFIAYQPGPDLLWRVVERSLMAAEESEDLTVFGGSVWLAAQAHRDAGDFDAAESVNREGMEVLEPHIGDANDRLRAMWGALQYEAGYTAARSGQQGAAWRWWDQADRTARTLPAAYYDPMTSFSRVIMGAHAVTLAVELRQGGESIRQATAHAEAAIPSQPRRGRHLVEVARAWRTAGDETATLATLQKAYTTAPETLRYNGYGRGMILELTEGPEELRRDAHGLADRVGLLV